MIVTPPAKKIVATDTEITKDVLSRVKKASRDRFEILDIRGIPKDRKGDVEVLMLKDSGLVGPELFKEFPNTKVLQSLSAGVDFIDISSIPGNVLLSSNAGAYKEPIAEHVFSMILFFAKNLERNHERLRAGVFDNSPDGTFLAGKTIGIVGAGGIGQAVAGIAKAFNMKTVGINTSGKPVPNFDVVWKMDHLDELLRLADFVVLSIPLNVHTRNLIDAKRLRTMKENVVLINVARGPLISQADLYQHLKSHPGFAAGIDVWWSYPKKGEKFSLVFPFFELPNFVASPHNADGVPEMARQGRLHALENVLEYIGGNPLQRVIDKNDYKGFKGARH